MKKCVILSAGAVTDDLKYHCEDANLIIAADAGWLHAKQWGITPDLCVGDYDSACVPKLKNTIVLPTEKDDTDTLYAVKKAIALDCNEITILGGLGGRLDHTIANIQTLYYLASKSVKGKLVSADTIVEVLGEGAHIIPKQKNAYLSFFALGKPVHVASIQGVQYEVSDFTFSQNYPIGVSNEWVQEIATVTITKGFLVCMICKKDTADMH